MKNSSLSNFILMSLLACMFFIACSKGYDLCEGEPDIEIRYREVVGAEAMKLYPYKGNETLTFISNKGDTATLVGKGQLFKYPKLRYSGNNDCTNFYHEHEILFTEFVGNNSNFNHLRLEVFNLKQAITLNPYINNKADFGDYWRGSGIGLYGYYRDEFSNIKFPFKDTLVSAYRFSMKTSLDANFYEQLILYREYGIIGYLPDSTTVYTLQ
jgi:hypothetical protein